MGDPINKSDPNGHQVADTADDWIDEVIKWLTRTSTTAAEATGTAAATGGGAVLVGAAIVFFGSTTSVNANRNVECPADSCGDVLSSEQGDDTPGIVVGPDTKAQPKKGPAPNLGNAPPHGGPEHDAAIRKKEAEVKALGATDVRINQVQVDINGNRVDDDNRPDLQYNLGGVHHNWEVDRDPARSAAHGERITANDPAATCTLAMLGDC